MRVLRDRVFPLLFLYSLAKFVRVFFLSLRASCVLHSFSLFVVDFGGPEPIFLEIELFFAKCSPIFFTEDEVEKYKYIYIYIYIYNII